MSYRHCPVVAGVAVPGGGAWPLLGVALPATVAVALPPWDEDAAALVLMMMWGSGKKWSGRVGVNGVRGQSQVSQSVGT
jgi:hypothetical protein